MTEWMKVEKKIICQLELLRNKIKCFKGNATERRHLEINLQTAEQLYEQAKEKNELRNRKY